jgi:hypothetical protein
MVSNWFRATEMEIRNRPVSQRWEGAGQDYRQRWSPR